MRRMILTPMIIIGAILLIVTGALAGVLLADDGPDGTSVTAEPSVETQGTGKGSLGLIVVPAADGLRVTGVEAVGPAATAGIQVGDIIRSIDGQVVRTPEELRGMAENKQPGEHVIVTHERGDTELRADVELGEAPLIAANATPAPTAPGPTATPALNRPDAQSQDRGGRLGITVQQITPEVQRRLDLARDSGVVVTDVNPNSAAAAAGIERNDIILAIGTTSVDTVGELQRAVLAAPVDRPIQISVQRGDDQMMLSQTLPAQSNLDGLGDLLPEELRERLEELLEDGTLPADRLQPLLRLYQSRGNGIQVGSVQSVEPGVARDTFVITMEPAGGGSNVTVQVTSTTSILRGSERIEADELKLDELILVISMDNGETAFQVQAFGS